MEYGGLEEEAEMVIGALWELKTGQAIWKTVREAEAQAGKDAAAAMAQAGSQTSPTHMD